MGEDIVALKIKKGDVFAIFIVLVLAAAAFFIPMEKSGDKVNIKTDKASYVYFLNEDRRITLEENGISLTVVIENGEVYVENSTCRDGVCKKSSPISDGGCIVCLPAHVVIQISSGGADAIAG
ncbi:MAG: NusG domain II-containing protein [Clostridia bacterium]|jgi:hypothetical protein|nr:NusG domain II-containing protein [Clostridia bacterium]